MNKLISLPKYEKLNWRTQGAVTLKKTSRLNKATGKQETFYDLNNPQSYSYRLMTPPCVARWPHIREGGNYNVSKFATTPSSSYITVDLLKSGGFEEFADERLDFFEHLRGLNASVLDQMYDIDIGGAATAARAKAKRYYKAKTPDEQEAKAREAFHKGAMTPLKEKDGINYITVKCKAFNRDGTARAHRLVKPDGNTYVEHEPGTNINNGALLSTVFTMRTYAMNKDKYGISYSLIPDIIAYTVGSSGGGQSVPDEVVDTSNREFAFKTVESKDKYYVNVIDSEGRRFVTRLDPTELEWNDIQTGTLDKFPGVTPSSAKLTGTLKEDTTSTASVAMFDHFAALVNKGIAHCIQDPNVLVKAKKEIAEAATEMAAETGETYESTFRTMVEDIFNSPVSKREDNDYRQLKIIQRQYPYDNETTPNVIPLFDADGNNVTQTLELARGSIIAPVVRPSFYFMPDGSAAGIKLEICLQRGIKVHSNPTAGGGGNGVLYQLKVGDTEEPSPKRMRIE